MEVKLKSSYFTATS